MPSDLKSMDPSKSKPGTRRGWTDQEEAAFDAIVGRLKHLREEHPEEVLARNLRHAIRQALKNFAKRRGLMIPFLKRSNPINRILGKCRYRLLGPIREA